MRKATTVAILTLTLLMSAPMIAGGPGVHINTVRVDGTCGEAARFVVDIQNNLGKVAHAGSVYVDQSRPGYPQAAFNSLAPGEHRTLTLTSSMPQYQINCAPGAHQSFRVSILMEPDGTANGEVWDGIAHTLTSTVASGRVSFTDSTPPMSPQLHGVPSPHPHL